MARLGSRICDFIKYSKKIRLDVNIKTRVRSKYEIFLISKLFCPSRALPLLQGCLDLAPRRAMPLPLYHIPYIPLPITSRCASSLPSYTHMCPLLAPTCD